MDFNVKKTDGVVNISFAGEFTIYAAADIKARLVESLGQGRMLDVDLEGVTEMDTSGVQLLILARREADMLGKGFRVSRCGEAAAAAIDVYNLREFFNIS
ncbi:MAG: STAS domain-containing protein [Deltaproteobacteria bacterium]|nr:STAS domain-containing protein [Deltaproteobacteria bacterium]